MASPRLNGAAKWILVALAVLGIIVAGVVAYKDVEAATTANMLRIDSMQGHLAAHADAVREIHKGVNEIKTTQAVNGKRLEHIEKAVNRSE